jgi:tetratricopeptide (TPR) repeat protein
MARQVMSKAGALILILGIVAGCAARTARGTPTDQLRAGELVREGCYDCLLEARQLYARTTAVNDDHRRGALEVELLIALREKELALDASSATARAATLASELGPNFARLIPIVDAIPPDSIGTPRAGRRLAAPMAAGPREKYVEETLAVIRSSTLSAFVQQYLAAAVACSADRGLSSTSAPPQDPPLLAYRAAICMNPIDAAALERVRSAVPRFVETALFLGRAAMATLAGTDGSRVRVFFDEAYARFPNSPAVTFHLATVSQATGDCRTAERFFTETLTLRDGHEDARLGRAICRTYQSSTEDAIADATVLIDSAADNRAEGYYWRAWNRRRINQLDAARSDINSARALLYNARVLTLAGMIEHDQRDFDSARTDLSRAIEMDARECQAAWYQGLVGFNTENWAESAAGFASAADCYAKSAAEIEGQRDAIARRTDLAEDFRTSQIAGFNAAIAEDKTQGSAADLNAAINYARAGDVPNATVYMKRAAIDPERRVAVEDLRQVLGVPRW